jgi:hypothetical protein
VSRAGITAWQTQEIHDLAAESVEEAAEQQRAEEVAGRERQQADGIVTDIEEQVRSSTGVGELPEPEDEITVRQREAIGFITIARTLLGRYPLPAALGAELLPVHAHRVRRGAYWMRQVVASATEQLPGRCRGDLRGAGGQQAVPFVIAIVGVAIVGGGDFGQAGESQVSVHRDPPVRGVQDGGAPGRQEDALPTGGIPCLPA